MDRETFKKLFLEAGFKNKQELAKALNLSYSAITQWGCGSVKFPPYIKSVLQWAIKARKYDEALKSDSSFCDSSANNALDSNSSAQLLSQINALKLENAKLKEELAKFEALKLSLKALQE